MFRSTAGILLLVGISVLAAACDSSEYDADFAEPVGPPDGTVFDTDDVILLLWDPAPRAASYTVEVSPDAQFSEIAASQRIGITTAEIGPLEKGIYHWRVMALELGKDDGPISPSRFFVVEDQRMLSIKTAYGFSFSEADLTGTHAEFVSPDSSAIRAELARIGIPNAEIRAILPQAVFTRLEEPTGATLNQIGSLDFLLSTAAGQQTAAVLNSPPPATYTPMTIVADSISSGGEPHGILQVEPAQNAPRGSYRISIEVDAKVLVVVP